MVEPGSGGSERLLILRLNSTTGPVTLISVYAPTLSTTPDTKDIFYGNLASIIRNIPSKEQVVVLGDFNARVGADHDSWLSCTATTGAAHLSWPVHHKLLLPHQASTQGFLETPTIKALAPTGSNPGQACCYQECSPHTLLPQCGLRDHSLVCCKIRMQPKIFHRTKTKGIPRIDVSKISQPDLMEQFAQTFEKEFGSLQPGDSVTEKWEVLRDTMYCTALATFERSSSKSHDWFKAKSTVMTPVIEAK